VSTPLTGSQTTVPGSIPAPLASPALTSVVLADVLPTGSDLPIRRIVPTRTTTPEGATA